MNSLGQHMPLKNRLTLSIFASVVGVFSVCMCCVGLILGLLAVIFATQAKTKYDREDFLGAQSSSQVAYTLSLISLGISILSILIYLFFAAIYSITDVSDIAGELDKVIIDHLY